MKTLILNGSPRAEKGNTEIFIRQFQRGQEAPGDIRYVVREKPAELAAYMERYDQVLFFMPLYIHAMPGIVMKLLEHARPCKDSSKAFGFVIQAGFMESETAAWAERALHCITDRLGYRYLGTVIRCNAAPTYMFPRFFSRKLFGRLRQLGRHYESDGVFHPETTEWLAIPRKLSPRNVKLWSSPPVVRLNKVVFDIVQRKNKCYGERLARPYI